jgi:4-amino-4-deoxy-L-arabinose transferase-like glycosyltransferase
MAHASQLSFKTALIIFLVIALALFFCAFQLKSYQNSEFDEGVYLATFKSVQNGFAPYSQTYMSQPPGFFVTTFPLYVAFGSTLEAARLAVFFYSLIGLFAIVWLGWELKSVLFAFIAISVLYLIPLYMVQILTFHGDSLPAAFSALALASMLRFRNIGKWLWVGLSAFFVAIAVLIKADFAVLPSLGVVLLVATLVEKKRIVDFIKAGVVFAASFIISFLLFTLPFGINDVYTNVIELRLRVAQGTSADPNTFFTFFNEQAELVNLLKAASVLSILTFIFVRDARFPLILLFLWVATTIVSLLVYHPLLPHHLTFLTVPIAVLFSFASFKLLNLIKVPRLLPAAVTILVLVMLVNRFNTATMPQSTQSTTPLQLRGIELVEAHTQPGDYIISDDGIVSALSNRLIPPYLTDISFVRIASGGVTAAHLEENIKTYQPKMILVWADRLRNVPNFEQIMSQYNYRLIEDPDTQHEAYLLES